MPTTKSVSLLGRWVLSSWPDLDPMWYVWAAGRQNSSHFSIPAHDIQVYLINGQLACFPLSHVKISDPTFFFPQKGSPTGAPLPISFDLLSRRLLGLSHVLEKPLGSHPRLVPTCEAMCFQEITLKGSLWHSYSLRMHSRVSIGFSQGDDWPRTRRQINFSRFDLCPSDSYCKRPLWETSIQEFIKVALWAS